MGPTWSPSSSLSFGQGGSTIGGARSLPPRATIFVGGGGRRLEQRVGLYTSGTGAVTYLAGTAGISSKRFPAELLRFAKLGLNLPRLKEEENLRSLRLLGVVRCAGT
jgi:hypothetical protein